MIPIKISKSNHPARSLKRPFVVIPAEAGIREFHGPVDALDSALYQMTDHETIKV
jgi:hypothetical protein